MITPALLRLFALAAGVAVGNITIAQPLLDELAGAFSISSAGAGVIITVTQVGYGLGLVLLVPLGDTIDRRRLVVTLMQLSAVALAVIATAPSPPVLLAGMAARRFPRGDDAGARRLRRLARRSPRSRAGDRDRHERGRARHPRGADPGRRHERCLGMAGGLPCRRGPHVARRMAAAARSPDGPPDRVLGLRTGSSSPRWRRSSVTNRCCGHGQCWRWSSSPRSTCSGRPSPSPCRLHHGRCRTARSVCSASSVSPVRSRPGVPDASPTADWPTSRPSSRWRR